MRTWSAVVLALGLSLQVVATVSGQVIDDPELAALPPAPPALAPPAPPDPSGQARAVLHARAARDLRDDGPREETWEATTLATLEASVRRSERLRLALGLRARHHFAALPHALPDANASRTQLDVVPTAGYADVKVAEGLHLTAGYQNVQLGRFDVLSATNVLATADLRDGVATLPEGTDVAQLAALLDYDATGWLSVRAVYVPFFTPHLMAFSESDYALSSAALAPAAPAGAQPSAADMRLLRSLTDHTDRGGRERLTAAGFAALAPDPDLAEPQVALRVLAHGPAGEVALTAATALEHLPALRIEQSVFDYAANPCLENEARVSGGRKVRVLHRRFGVLSADAATELGPVSVGVELAYMLGRTLTAVRPGTVTEPCGMQAAVAPRPDTSDLAQAGARVEYLQGTEWLFALESFVAVALDPPSDPRRQWLMLEDGRFATAALLLAGFAPESFGLRVEVAAGVLHGPSVVIAPRVGYLLVPELEVEVGAVFVEGRRARAPYAADAALGGLYDDVDQAYVGVRVIP